jgi:type IV secretion system protein VirD4
MPLTPAPYVARQRQMIAASLASLGADHMQRVRAINAMYDERRATITAMGVVTVTLKGDVAYSATSPFGLAHMSFVVSRNLAGMDNRDREYLRIIELLNSAVDGTYSFYNTEKVALLYGDGKGSTSEMWLPKGNKLNFQQIYAKAFGSVDLVINEIQQHIALLDQDSSLHPAFRAIVDEAKGRISPSGGGAWLKSSEVAGTAFADKGPYKLYIGTLDDGSMLSYSGDGSMVTIAPPGSGKTQCNVFPNLLVWQGPAIVLDVSGDLYEHTAAWRAANVGPIYKFDPLAPEDSNKYNPLTFVRQEPDYIWEDSRLLAEMMIVPSGAADPFWENEARTVLTAAIAYVCYSNEPAERPMSAVLDVLFGGEAWDDMILGLKMAIDVHVMTQHANSLSSMNEKTLSSVLQTARSSLGAWTGERVARATARSDWDPLELRSATNPTIYISVQPNQVETYLSLLRVFIGQHIRVLTGGRVPPRDAPPILVMLDELPRLRYMSPVDEALNIGRKYNLRLWMFAQSVGQFQVAYPNADGMLGSCAVRIFMNPSGADGLAERLSEELGYVDSLNDNSRKRLVDAAELAGPSYKDKQLVLAAGTKPAIVRKDFAFANPELARRMDMQSDGVQSG